MAFPYVSVCPHPGGEHSASARHDAAWNLQLEALRLFEEGSGGRVSPMELQMRIWCHNQARRFSPARLFTEPGRCDPLTGLENQVSIHNLEYFTSFRPLFLSF